MPLLKKRSRQGYRQEIFKVGQGDRQEIIKGTHVNKTTGIVHNGVCVNKVKKWQECIVITTTEKKIEFGPWDVQAQYHGHHILHLVQMLGTKSFRGMEQVTTPSW